MIENRPIDTFVSHVVLLAGIAIVMFPVWITLVAASHDAARLLQVPLPLGLGDQFFENLKHVVGQGVSNSVPLGLMLFNSLVMALMIAFGKIAISLLSAYAIVYFDFRFRMLFFWMIFITLMLPVEVRILPTYEVVAKLNMLDSYWGLSIPLIASATATFTR